MSNVEKAIKDYMTLRANDCTHKEAIERIGNSTLSAKDYAEFRKAVG